MKWKIEISGIDLGTLIPTPGELEPHDHPIEAWAGQVVHDLLNRVHLSLCLAKMDVIMKDSSRDRTEVETAMIASYDLEIAVAERLYKNCRVIQEVEDLECSGREGSNGNPQE